MNPYDVSLNVQKGFGFLKGSVTANYHLTFKKKKKGLDVRFFAGQFLENKNMNNGNYYINASGGNGMHDYLYDYVYLGRSESTGFLSHQFGETEGAMKVYTPIGRSNTKLASLNLKCTLPGKLPIKLFADFSMIPKASAVNETTIYDAGIYIPLVKDMIEVYFPILVS